MGNALNQSMSLYIPLFVYQDAFSLLAYSNPWSSPLGWQLCPSRRETVCAALNSAILGESEKHMSVNLYYASRRSILEVDGWLVVVAPLSPTTKIV